MYDRGVIPGLYSGKFGGQDKTWTEILRRSREKPGRRLGIPASAHISSIIRPLEMCFVTRSIVDVRSATIRLSERGALLAANGGSFHPLVEPHLALESTDCLVGELFRASVTLLDSDDPAIRTLFRSTVGLDAGSNALCLANWGAIGIRARGSLWFQTYVHGWPVTPVTRFETPDVSVIQALSLPESLYTGLPYRVQDVKSAIRSNMWKERAKIDVRIYPGCLDVPEPPPWIIDPRQTLERLLGELK